MNFVSILIVLTISAAVPAVFGACGTGPSGVSSCAGMPDGDYQSCHGCNVYATCTNRRIVDNRACPASLVWDDANKVCAYTSNCRAYKCGNPTTFSNAILWIVSGYSYGDVAIYKCPPNRYFVKDYSIDVEAISSCKINNAWSLTQGCTMCNIVLGPVWKPNSYDNRALWLTYGQMSKIELWHNSDWIKGIRFTHGFSGMAVTTPIYGQTTGTYSTFTLSNNEHIVAVDASYTYTWGVEGLRFVTNFGRTSSWYGYDGSWGYLYPRVQAGGKLAFFAGTYTSYEIYRVDLYFDGCINSNSPSTQDLVVGSTEINKDKED